MDFLKELFGIEDLNAFLKVIAGNQYMLYDYLFLALGTFFIYRILRGRGGIFLLFVMVIFVSILHYNTDKTVVEAVIKAYSVNGIGFFRQEIFMGIGVLFMTFITRFEDNDAISSLLPIFIMIESVNIYYAVGSKPYEQWPFWGILIAMLAIHSGILQAETDIAIEDKILNGSASESDHAYWLKRKREKEDDDFYQQQYYDHNH